MTNLFYNWIWGHSENVNCNRPINAHSKPPLADFKTVYLFFQVAQLSRMVFLFSHFILGLFSKFELQLIKQYSSKTPFSRCLKRWLYLLNQLKITTLSLTYSYSIQEQLSNLNCDKPSNTLSKPPFADFLNRQFIFSSIPT